MAKEACPKPLGPQEFSNQGHCFVDILQQEFSEWTIVFAEFQRLETAENNI